MTFIDSATRAERILGVVVLGIGALMATAFLHRRQGTPAEIQRQSVNVMRLALLLVAFVLVAAVVLLVWSVNGYVD